MPTVIRQSHNQPLTLSTPLAAGGEAIIYVVDGGLVAKVYHQWQPYRAAKLAAMLANPPSALLQGTHVAIAWPCELLYDGHTRDRVVGFLMPRVGGMQPIFEFYIPKARRASCPLFTYRYLLITGRNLAWAVRAVHQRGYVIGDINESNILVRDTGQVTLVDTDSFQVRDPHSDTLFRCPVGKPEFTPPELYDCHFATIDRTVEHDLFGLGVLIFRLLLEGVHPFDGVYTGAGEAPQLEERIAAGHFPHGKHLQAPYHPKPSAVPFAVLPPAVQKLCLQCFENGFRDPTARPTADEWVHALESSAENLQQCTENPSHCYDNHLPACPWCERAARLGRDSFPSPQAVRQGFHQHPQPRPTVRSAPATSVPASPTARPASTVPTTTRLHPTSTPSVPASPPVGTRRITWIIVACLLMVLGVGWIITSQRTQHNNPRTMSEPSVTINKVANENINPIDGAEIVHIPAGEFMMGSADTDKLANNQEKPQRRVYLDAYYIYKTEVTVAQYRAFCTATGRPLPPWPNYWGSEHGSGWMDPTLQEHPIKNVNWEDAAAYAQWAGAALPTEAQWEKAARGADGRVYPWGNAWDGDMCQNDVGDNRAINTAPVGNFPAGASPYGVLDMAGNASEWCADWFQRDYYRNAPTRNPTGPTGKSRVQRGGAYSDHIPSNFRTASRLRNFPTYRYDDFGFRCVLRSPIP